MSRREKKPPKAKRINQKCGTLLYKCENCDHEVEFTLNAKFVDANRAPTQHVPQNNLNVSPVPRPIIPAGRDFPVVVEVKHSGFWMTSLSGVHMSTNEVNCKNNSVMLTPDCLLYVYKLALRHLLLSTKVIATDVVQRHRSC